jgi:hypothetical protein
MNSDLSVLEKIRLFVMLGWYFIQSQADVTLLALADYKPVFLQMVMLFTIATVSCPYGHWQSSLKPIFIG